MQLFTALGAPRDLFRAFKTVCILSTTLEKEIEGVTTGCTRGSSIKKVNLFFTGRLLGLLLIFMVFKNRLLFYCLRR